MNCDALNPHESGACDACVEITTHYDAITTDDDANEAAFEEVASAGNFLRRFRLAALDRLRRERIERARLVKQLWVEAMFRCAELQRLERIQRIRPHSVVMPCVPFVATTHHAARAREQWHGTFPPTDIL